MQIINTIERITRISGRKRLSDLAPIAINKGRIFVKTCSAMETTNRIYIIVFAVVNGLS